MYCYILTYFTIENNYFKLYKYFKILLFDFNQINSALASIKYFIKMTYWPFEQ